MLSLFNIILIACVSSASLFAAGSSGYDTADDVTADDVAEIIRRNPGKVAEFFEGDAVAVIGCHTLVPAHNAGHRAAIQAFSEESGKEGGFYWFNAVKPQAAKLQAVAALLAPLTPKYWALIESQMDLKKDNWFESGPQAALLGSHPGFLIYRADEPRASRLIYSTDVPMAYISFALSKKRQYWFKLYVAADHRGKGMGPIALSLACVYLDKLRTIEGLERIKLVSECPVDNIAMLRVMGKARAVPFDLRDQVVYFSYPPSEKVIAGEDLSIIEGLSSVSAAERGKARYDLFAKEKARYLASLPEDMRIHVALLYNHLMEACRDGTNFSDAGLKAAYNEVSAAEGGTSLQLAAQAMKEYWNKQE